MERRDFLKMFVALGVGSAFAGYKFFDFLEERERRLKTEKRTLPLMGTFVTVWVVDESRDRAQESIQAFFEEAERLIKIFDRHDPSSVLSELNRSSRLKDFPFELFEVLSFASSMNSETLGYFDVTVKPILDLFSEFAETKRLPKEDEIRSVLKRVGMDKMKINREEIRFLGEGMGITLDGVAKGYIVEKASDRLRRQGIKSALINAGGDIMLIGDNRGRPWKIGIMDPHARDRVCKVFYLRDCAIATSGSYERYFDAEGKYHHLIDPKIGISPSEFQSMSVIHKSLTVADCLSTSFFVAPEKVRNKLLREFKGIKVYGVSKGREILI